MLVCKLMNAHSPAQQDWWETHLSQNSHEELDVTYMTIQLFMLASRWFVFIPFKLFLSRSGKFLVSIHHIRSVQKQNHPKVPPYTNFYFCWYPYNAVDPFCSQWNAHMFHPPYDMGPNESFCHWSCYVIHLAVNAKIWHPCILAYSLSWYEKWSFEQDEMRQK